MSIAKTYVAMILDKSGSMNTIASEAINHFNEQLQVLKEESNAPNQIAKKMLKDEDVKGIETHLTLVEFNQDVETIVLNDDVNNVSELNHNSYQPGGMTALYDAIGKTIKKFLDFDGINDSNVSVLFSIITDGEENASKEFPGEEGRKRIKSQIEELQKSGQWTFTFLGANQDVLETAVDGLGIYQGNVATYDYSSKGLNIAMQAHTNGTKAYFNALKSNSVMASTDFYGDIKDLGTIEFDDDIED